jgi:integrase/recombinase XerD
VGQSRRASISCHHSGPTQGGPRTSSIGHRRQRGIFAVSGRADRIHDLRHTFATRSLERCSTRRESVSRHFVSLATYVGHTDIVHTYWYLEATPELTANLATAAEALIAKGAHYADRPPDHGLSTRTHAH